MNLPSDFKKFSYKQFPRIACVGFFTLVLAQFASAQALQNLSTIRQEAEKFLVERYQSEKNEQLIIKLGTWDKRLKLSACHQPISFSLQDTAGPGGNVTLDCRCLDQNGWAIHLPAQVDIFRALPVASRNLSRGTVVDMSDIGMEVRNISPLGDSLELDNSAIAGKALKRSMNAGDAFKTTLLDQPKTISRGELVSITTKSGSIQVVMQGVAMTDGKLGQQIRVKNSQSERIINAKVVGQAAVEIL